NAYIVQYAPDFAEALQGDPDAGPPTGRVRMDDPARQYHVVRGGEPFALVRQVAVMSIGPLHVLVIGFDHPGFTGAALAELARLERSDVVRLVDLLFVEKSDTGDITALTVEELDPEQAAVLGDLAGAFVGLGADLDGDGVPDELDDEVWDIAEEIPPGSVAAVVLLEHRWAAGLRDALAE